MKRSNENFTSSAVEVAIVAREFQPFLQRELDGLIVDLLYVGGRVVLPLGRARLEFHEPLADGQDDVHFERTGTVGRVEVPQILVDAHDTTAVCGVNDIRPGLTEDRDPAPRLFPPEILFG